MIKVTVHSAVLDHKTGNARATGKPYSMFEQVVYFHTLDKAGNPNPFPEKGRILVDKDPAGNGIAYQPGEYLLHPASVYVDQYGGLSVAPKLVPSKR